MSTEPVVPPDSVNSTSDPAPTRSVTRSRRNLRLDRRVRNLILDYALGTSILGLIPIPRLFTLKLILAGGFILKMIWDIGKMRRFPKGQDFLAIAGAFFGTLGAFAMAATAWLTIFGVGVFFPYLKGLAFAAALFTLVWAIGQAVSQFYASGHEKERYSDEN